MPSSSATWNARQGRFAAARARVIDEHPPHHLRGDAKKVRAVLPGDALLPDQLEVDLVHERGRLKGVSGGFVTQEARGLLSQLAIDERQQIIACLQVALAPRAQQSAHVARWP